MKLLQFTIQKHFTVKNKGKIYYVDYINSDDRIMLGNRDYWEVLNEDLEELPDYDIKNNKIIANKKELKLKKKLIKFCIKHFNDYQPNYKEDC